MKDCRLIVVDPTINTFEFIDNTTSGGILPEKFDYSLVPMIVIVKGLHKPALTGHGNYTADAIYQNLTSDDWVVIEPSEYNTGGIIVPKETILIRAYNGSINMEKSIRLAVIKTLRTRGIMCFNTSNDLKIKQDDLDKKFYGDLTREYKYGKSCNSFITIKPDFELIQLKLRADSFKYDNKEAPEKFEDVIADLSRLGIDKSIVDGIIPNLALECGFNFYDDTYTDSEMEFMYAVRQMLRNN